MHYFLRNHGMNVKVHYFSTAVWIESEHDSTKMRRCLSTFMALNFRRLWFSTIPEATLEEKKWGYWHLCTWCSHTPPQIRPSAAIGLYSVFRQESYHVAVSSSDIEQFSSSTCDNSHKIPNWIDEIRYDAIIQNHMYATLDTRKQGVFTPIEIVVPRK